MKSITRPELDPNFMVRGYSVINEPLNLHELGQQWFDEIYTREVKGSPPNTLILGATAWLARLALRDLGRVIIADISPVMLENARAEVISSTTAEYSSTLETLETNWTNLPDLGTPFGRAMGDNSLAFLTFPDEWVLVINRLADRMAGGAKLLIRMISPPQNHRQLSCDEIVAKYAGAESINYTAVRAELLFAHRSRTDYSIHTRKALDTFEKNKSKFDVLLRQDRNVSENDLLTIEKYRSSGLVVYAPPLDELLPIIRSRFSVTQIHYGPYALSECFPLLVAVLK